jgi:prepilin-type N-terminal cleavage/methylation domain-containing protein
MNSQGFSMLEMLLSVGIISILAGLSLPIYLSFQTRNDLFITAESTADVLRRAQVYARGSKDDSQWGVEIQSSGVTLFKGTSFASRDTSYDETIAISSGVSGLTEVLFAKLTGAPSTTGNITFTSNANETKTVTINAKGMVSY